MDTIIEVKCTIYGGYGNFENCTKKALNNCERLKNKTFLDLFIFIPYGIIVLGVIVKIQKILCIHTIFLFVKIMLNISTMRNTIPFFRLIFVKEISW